jgi:uncharacterized delta-60 repeat protein
MRRSLRTIRLKPTHVALLAILALAPTYATTDVEVDWVRQYDSGNDPAFDAARSVAVDSSGNAYVTGLSYGSNELPDFATIKYGSLGDTLWVQRYNGPGNNWDAATALAIDTSGNVYVTGESYGSNFFDYVTIKYNSSGVQQWVARYNGPGNSDERANAIAVDASGNVYVTGYSIGSATFYDYATVKYSATGQQQWVARYNGPGNTKDRAFAIAVDGSGNVYVTGDSGEGSPNLSDYVTVKYNSSGTQQWVARYNNAYDYATALAVDAAGNAYVTGYSFGSGTFYDYATVKYNARGRQRWVARFHGGVGDDLAYDLGVDASGNVYVTGESVGPDTGSDYGTVKYNANGKQQWVARYNGPGSATDSALALAFDGSGNVYVTGESEGSGTVTDFATIKYTAGGVLQWVARHNGTGNTFDHATALAINGSGDVYVTGRSAQTGASTITTVKYSQN